MGQQETNSEHLDWEEVLAASRKDVRGGRKLLVGIAAFSVAVSLLALNAGVLADLPPSAPGIILGCDITLTVLAVGCWYHPIPAFRVAKWLAYALAAVSAVLAVLAAVQGLGMKEVVRAVVKFGGYAWGAGLLSEAESGAVILAAPPGAENYYDEIMQDLDGDDDLEGENDREAQE